MKVTRAYLPVQIISVSGNIQVLIQLGISVF
jgi:hypothetical protein